MFCHCKGVLTKWDTLNYFTVFPCTVSDLYTKNTCSLSLME